MLYITGDIHGDITPLKDLCRIKQCTENDTVIVVGDVGINYFGDGRDKHKKEQLKKLEPTFFFIHGNHEERPNNILSYKEIGWHGGNVYVQEKYPNLVFAKDGEYYNLEGLETLVIGGAYSVDKWYRLQHNMKWFEDEQPSEESKKRALSNIEKHNFHADLVLTHTCPYKFEPKEKYLPGIDQYSVDKTTEYFLDAVEKKLNYDRWVCGHWHIDKDINNGKFSFLYHQWMQIENKQNFEMQI